MVGRYGAFLMRHLCQSLNLLSVQPEPFSNATAVIWVGLVEQGCLAQLDAFFRIAQVVYNITDQVIPMPFEFSFLREDISIMVLCSGQIR